MNLSSGFISPLLHGSSFHLCFSPCFLRSKSQVTILLCTNANHDSFTPKSRSQNAPRGGDLEGLHLTGLDTVTGVEKTSATVLLCPAEEKEIQV